MISSLDICPICRREVPIVPVGSDVPLPFLSEDTTRQRWHVGCVEGVVLTHVRRDGGAMAALRVVALVRAAETRLPPAPVWTDEEPN